MSPRAKIVVFLLGLCALLNIYSTQPLLSELAHEFGVSSDQSTWTISATTLGVAIVAPLAGSVSDRLGRRRVILSAIAATVAATVACAMAGSFAALLGFRFVQGLLIPFVFAVALAYIADETTGSAAATANSLYVSGTAFGGFCGRFFSGAITGRFGWRSSFLLLAAVMLATFVATTAWLPRERRFHRSDSLLASVRGISRHLRNPRLLGTCSVGAALLFLQVGSFTYAGLRLEAPPFGLDTFQTGLVFAVFLVAVVVTPFAGRLITRIGRLGTFTLAGATALAGMAISLVPTTATVIAGLAASCVGVFCGQSCTTGYVAGIGGSGRSSAVGLYLTSYYLGGGIGAVAPAPVYAHTGWTGCVALLSAVIALSVGVAALVWRAHLG